MTAIHTHSNAEVAVKDDQVAFDQKQIAVLQRYMGKGVRGATVADFGLLFQQMRRTGLDPFSRQIYLIMREEYDKDIRQKVPKPTIQIGIDGFRLIAKRAANTEGVRITHKNPLWCGEDGVWKDVWLSPTPPSACKYRIEVGGAETEMTVMFAEYVPMMDEYSGSGNDRQKTGKKVPMGLWSSMPASQIAKCAEAVTLRKAFPQDLSGLYAEEEMERNDVIDVQPHDTPEGVVHSAEAPSEDAPAAAASEPVDAERDWVADMMSAGDGNTLSSIWQEAKNLGQMTPELDKLARTRGEEFRKAAQQEAAPAQGSDATDDDGKPMNQGPREETTTPVKKAAPRKAQPIRDNGTKP